MLTLYTAVANSPQYSLTYTTVSNLNTHTHTADGMAIKLKLQRYTVLQSLAYRGHYAGSALTLMTMHARRQLIEVFLFLIIKTFNDTFKSAHL